MTKLQAGIIGCGQIAGGYDTDCKKGWSLTHACSYQLLDNVELVATSDPDDKVRAEFCEKWGVKNDYADHKEMLEDLELDIVSICSPTEYHIDAFRAISEVESVKGVFCEKPLSYKLDEAREIADLAKGKIVSLNYFRRWNLTLQQLRKDLKSKKYGEVQYITVRYTKGLLTNGSHLVDLLYWMFGEPIGYFCYFIHSKNSYDPGVDFKLAFQNEVTAVLLHVPDVPYVYIEIDILTDAGKLSIKQRGQQIEWSDVVIEPNYHTFNMLKSDTIKETKWQDCPTRALKELIDVVQCGGDVYCTPMDGLKVGEICARILSLE